jgi:ABC-type transporter Mla maintaining outer membrane lipid asymmetry ATPase subunit MlaF
MDDCDVPVDVVVAHITSATSAIADNFAVADDGSIMRAGNAEMSDAEEEEAVLPTVLGRGQRKKIGARRYNGPAWEGH